MKPTIYSLSDLNATHSKALSTPRRPPPSPITTCIILIRCHSSPLFCSWNPSCYQTIEWICRLVLHIRSVISPWSDPILSRLPPIQLPHKNRIRIHLTMRYLIVPHLPAKCPADSRNDLISTLFVCSWTRWCGWLNTYHYNPPVPNLILHCCWRSPFAPACPLFHSCWWAWWSFCLACDEDH